MTHEGSVKKIFKNPSKFKMMENIGFFCKDAKIWVFKGYSVLLILLNEGIYLLVIEHFNENLSKRSLVRCKCALPIEKKGQQCRIKGQGGEKPI